MNWYGIKVLQALGLAGISSCPSWDRHVFNRSSRRKQYPLEAEAVAVAAYSGD